MKKVTIVLMLVFVFFGFSALALAEGPSCPSPPQYNYCPSCIQGSGGIIGGYNFSDVGLKANAKINGTYDYQGPVFGKGYTEGIASLEVNNWDTGFNIKVSANVSSMSKVGRSFGHH